jgi:DNA-binding MarR family transcriptional regulator
VADTVIVEEAAAITSMLGRLMRRLSTLEDNDPAMYLPAAQLRVCAILLDGSLTMSALSREMRTSLSAVTQIADRLERAGMVERVHEEYDRRVKSLQLTERGVEVMRSRRERRTRRMVEVLERLSPESRARVRDALQALIDAGRESPSETSHAAMDP